MNGKVNEHRVLVVLFCLAELSLNTVIVPKQYSIQKKSTGNDLFHFLSHEHVTDLKKKKLQRQTCCVKRHEV